MRHTFSRVHVHAHTHSRINTYLSSFCLSRTPSSPKGYHASLLPFYLFVCVSFFSPFSLSLSLLNRLVSTLSVELQWYCGTVHLEKVFTWRWVYSKKKKKKRHDSSEEKEFGGGIDWNKKFCAFFSLCYSVSYLWIVKINFNKVTINLFQKLLCYKQHLDCFTSCFRASWPPGEWITNPEIKALFNQKTRSSGCKSPSTRHCINQRVNVVSTDFNR